MYLVDTSVWIDFLRGTENAWTSLLEALLREGEAGICPMVYAEICFGAQDELQLARYRKKFAALPMFTLPDTWHEDAATMGFALRRKGHKPFIADMMIALTAIKHELPLISKDSDFAIYTKLFGLTLNPINHWKN